MDFLPLQINFVFLPFRVRALLPPKKKLFASQNSFCCHFPLDADGYGHHCHGLESLLHIKTPRLMVVIVKSQSGHDRNLIDILYLTGQWST